MKKWIFISIIVLTALDLVFTYAGIKLNFIQEANPFFANAFQSNPIMGALKSAAVSFAGLTVLYLCRHRIRWINHALIGLFIVKLAVLGMHVDWIVQTIRI